MQINRKIKGISCNRFHSSVQQSQFDYTCSVPAVLIKMISQSRLLVNGPLSDRLLITK